MFPYLLNVKNVDMNGIPANMLSGDGCRKCGTKKAHERFVKRLKS